MTKPTPPRTPSALKLQITQAEWEQLYKNGLIQAKVKGTSKELDPVPVVKLFYPASSATWLLTEVEPDEPDIAWGLCRAQHKPHYVEQWIMLNSLEKAPCAFGGPGNLLNIIFMLPTAREEHQDVRTSK